MPSYLHILSAANATLAWAALYLILIRPGLAGDPRRHLMWLTAPHLFRYLGLAALYPALFPVRDLGFSEDYLAQIAWGDTVAGWLALATLIALAARWRLAVALAWLFNVVGLADFLNAGLSMALPLAADPASLGALGWILLTFYLPLLTVLHIASFALLWRQGRTIHAANVG
jgi:hypothetical protein